MKSFYLFSFWVCLAVFAKEVEPQLHSMSELELMAKNKDWSRVILYIKDVPKSERDLQWKNLLERAAFGYVSTLKQEGASDAEKMVEDLEFEFPTLKESLKFGALKDRLFLDGFGKCFSKRSDVPNCAKSAVSFMNQKVASPNLRQDLAKLTFSNFPDALEELCNFFNSSKELKGFFENNCLKLTGRKINK